MTYIESLYFTYTTLLTIGYGDFYPRSQAGKPFFVVWSLISVPAMTVLISNMGDTVVKLVQDVTVWASKWTILPERDPQATLKHGNGKRKHKIGVAFPLHRRHSRQASHSGESNNRPAVEQPDESDTSHTSRLEHDIEYLGEHVEGFEEEEGRGGSLAARLAREISHLAKDIRSKPPKKYTWEEWERWLELLGEREPPEERNDQSASRTGQSASQSPPPEILDCNSLDDTKSQSDASPPSAVERNSKKTAIASPSQLNGRRGQPRDTANNTRDRTGADQHWRWTWLDDKGPLFSELTETEWIIERLCFRMEEVLEDEIRQAREGGQHKTRCKVRFFSRPCYSCLN